LLIFIIEKDIIIINLSRSFSVCGGFFLNDFYDFFFIPFLITEQVKSRSQARYRLQRFSFEKATIQNWENKISAWIYIKEKK